MVPCWGDKNRVPFMFLCQVFDLISEKASQEIINNIACNMLRIVMETNPDDLIPMVHLSANKIVETGSDSDLGVDESLIIKLLAETYGITEKRVKDKKKTSGDLGKTAENLRSCSSQYVMYKPQPLTVAKVFDTFQIIAKLTGKDSEKKKINCIKPVIIAAGGCQLKYIIWFLLQKSKRIGFGDQTILEALGHAAVYHKNPDPKSVDSCLKLKASNIVKRAISICPVYSKLINVILNGGVWEIPKECGLTVGVPVNGSLERRCEGLIIKDFDGLYEPDIDYIEGVRDSLDLVPIAAYYGKCEGVYGSFLMACYDRANGKYESICKLGIGFTEPKLKEIHSRFQSKVITEPKPDYLYDAVAFNPDVWFETSEVWVVNVRGFTISSDYCAAIGMVKHDKGLSARFPRFIREGDKDPDQATSSEQIAEMYKEQFPKLTQ
ncbi:hypothetical protein CCACVL1_00305 [Corchorus capsularis]|uniref:ATP-dependent DNA ligase family profile domain-containing protein n=1 Tax=Corchorus capsularis TaxID=210143 RepID=A0A1R3KX95_COCAP|nr:hypothetical protein CCACVL1_00305 [Corchorus capsularis]